jgi:carboxypeptidase Taq
MPSETSLQQLRVRLAELADLGSLTRLVAWDQRTMMPPEGAPARAHQVATLERIAHDLGTDAQIGAWLDAIEADGAGLDAVDRDVVRLARRDYELTARIPTEAEVVRLARPY